MVFVETELEGAFLVELEKREDERGFFARTFCAREFEARALRFPIAQCSISFNHRKGTLRGMHYQAPPEAEVKLVRCTKGAIFDVIVDLREDSETYLRYVVVELSEDNRRSLYIPQMFAHGFQTLADNTEVFYQMDRVYTPGFERGRRYDDPALAIEWPLPPVSVNSRDTNWPLIQPRTERGD